MLRLNWIFFFSPVPVGKQAKNHLMNPLSELLSQLLLTRAHFENYLRNFSRSSRLQEDQDRSLGFLPFTHSPDIMWEWPVQVAWSSSWLIPTLKAKQRDN